MDRARQGLGTVARESGGRLHAGLRWSVAAVFVVAAVGKALEFGTAAGRWHGVVWLPETVQAPFAVALATVEVCLALALLSRRWQTHGAFLGAGLAGAFALYTWLRMRCGDTGACHCFGTIGSLPAQTTLRLDLALLGACLVLVLGEPTGCRLPDQPRQPLRLPRAALAAMVAWVLIVYTLQAKGSERWLAQRTAQAEAPVLHRLGVGDPSPEALSRQTVDAAWRLFVFIDPGCPSCFDWLRAVETATPGWAGQVAVRVVVPVNAGSASEEVDAERVLGRKGIVLATLPDPGGRLADQCLDEPAEWPFAVLLDGDGTIRYVARRGQVPRGDPAAEVELLVRDVPFAAPDAGPRGAWLGRPVADLAVSTPGGSVRLAKLWADRPLVVGFVDPACGTCLHQERELLKWAEGRPVTLLLVYPTEAEATAASAEHGEAAVTSWSWEWLTSRWQVRRQCVVVVTAGRLALVAEPPLALSGLTAAIAGARPSPPEGAAPVRAGREER